MRRNSENRELVLDLGPDEIKGRSIGQLAVNVALSLLEYPSLESVEIRTRFDDGSAGTVQISPDRVVGYEEN